MKPYYQDEWGRQYCGDALKVLSELEGDSLDLLATDPPYGISFMGKDWDKALPDIEIWRQCLRVLKAGSFAFVMSIPRADCLSRMIISLEDAGFLVNFTPIFWAYASGFPKAQNIGKAVDKKMGAERARVKNPVGNLEPWRNSEGRIDIQDTIPDDNTITPQAKALDGSYGGFQPKPAVEVIIVAMKPLSEKTFVDQALKTGKGITWLDDCRIPTEDVLSIGSNKRENGVINFGMRNNKEAQGQNPQGRFPANLLVSDDVLDDGRIDKGTKPHKVFSNIEKYEGYGTITKKKGEVVNFGDSGSFSRYFDLDKWWAKTFPFLIVPKASKSEKNKGLGDIEPQQVTDGRNVVPDYPSQRGQTMRHNLHPTVKPLKLMSYLITLGSREGDTVLDPFLGSGTTAVASKLLGRKCIGIEIEEKYCEISANRCRQMVFDFKGGGG